MWTVESSSVPLLQPWGTGQIWDWGLWWAGGIKQIYVGLITLSLWVTRLWWWSQPPRGSQTSQLVNETTDQGFSSRRQTRKRALCAFKQDFTKHLYRQVPPLQLPRLLRISCPDLWSAEVWKRPLESGAAPSQGWPTGVKRETKTSVLWGDSDHRLQFVKVHQTGVDQNRNKSPQWHQWQNWDNAPVCARPHGH